MATETEILMVTQGTYWWRGAGKTRLRRVGIECILDIMKEDHQIFDNIKEKHSNTI